MQLTIAIAKAGRSINVDTDRLVSDPESFNAVLSASPKLAYVLNYGLTQTLNDAHASPKFKGADVIMAVVQKKLDSIYAGTIRTRGDGTPRETDPVAAEIKRRTIAWWKKEGGKKAVDDARAQYPGLAKKTDMEIAAALMTAFMNAPETIAAAKAMVAAKSMKVNIKLNLSDFGMADPDESEDDEVLMIEDQSDESDEDDSNDE